MVEFYTDGACSTNGSWNGGWAVVRIDYHHDGTEIGVIRSGHELNTTNNRMEMIAVIEALKQASKQTINNRTQIIIHTDSAYIVNSFEKGWIENWKKNGWRNSKKEPVKNKDLWLEMLNFIDICGGLGKVIINKVAGHATNKWNNIADVAAVNAREGKVV